MKEIKIGIIGGGLMGREIASAFARWCALTDVPARPVLTAVADLHPPTLDWFDAVPTCTLKTTDYRELLANPAIDVVYVAVPHHLHETHLSATCWRRERICSRRNRSAWIWARPGAFSRR